MHRRTTRALAVPAAAALLALAACSSDDSSTEATGSSSAPGGTTATDDAMTDDTAMDGSMDGDCPSETDLAVEGSELEPGDDLEWVWAVSDDGPDVLNGDDQNMELGFATYELPEDPQFGIEIPVGVPDVPEGETFFNISLFSPDGPLEPGQVFIDQLVYDEDPAAYDGEINFFSFYVGADRDVLFADFEVTITDITIEHVCGTIEPVEGGSGATIEGEFVVDRIEYLDGDIPEGAEE